MMACSTAVVAQWLEKRMLQGESRVGGLIYSGLGLEKDNKASHFVNNQNHFF